MGRGHDRVRIRSSPALGPMSLLSKSRLNHPDKLAFKQIYWCILLPDLPILFVDSRMSAKGKRMGILENHL